MDSGSKRSGVRALIALLAVVAIGLVPAAAADVGAAPHAYYLFLAGAPQGAGVKPVEGNFLGHVAHSAPRNSRRS